MMLFNSKAQEQTITDLKQHQTLSKFDALKILSRCKTETIWPHMFAFIVQHFLPALLELNQYANSNPLWYFSNGMTQFNEYNFERSNPDENIPQTDFFVKSDIQLINCKSTEEIYLFAAVRVTSKNRDAPFIVDNQLSETVATLTQSALQYMACSVKTSALLADMTQLKNDSTIIFKKYAKLNFEFFAIRRYPGYKKWEVNGYYDGNLSVCKQTIENSQANTIIPLSPQKTFYVKIEGNEMKNSINFILLSNEQQQGQKLAEEALPTPMPFYTIFPEQPQLNAFSQTVENMTSLYVIRKLLFEQLKEYQQQYQPYFFQNKIDYAINRIRHIQAQNAVEYLFRLSLEYASIRDKNSFLAKALNKTIEDSKRNCLAKASAELTSMLEDTDVPFIQTKRGLLALLIRYSNSMENSWHLWAETTADYFTPNYCSETGAIAALMHNEFLIYCVSTCTSWTRLYEIHIEIKDLKANWSANDNFRAHLEKISESIETDLITYNPRELQDTCMLRFPH